MKETPTLLYPIIICATAILIVTCQSDINPEGEWTNFNTDDGLASNMVFDADEAPDGSIWLATFSGVSRFTPNGTFENLTTADGLPSDYILTIVCGEDGRVWVGTDSGLAIIDGDSISTYTTADGLPSNNINCVSLEDADTAWVGTNDAGLCQFTPGGEVTVYDTSNTPLQSDIIWDIAVASADKIIIATDAGAAIFIPPNNWQIIDTGDGLASNQVFCAYPSGEVIWFGTGGGVSKFSEGIFTNFNTSNSGLSDNAVSGICADNDGDPIWFATLNGGVNRLQGETTWTVYGPGNQPGPLINGINSALCTSKNIKWFGTNGGGASRYSPPVQ
jgi:ligand-binding sensor domain-containing protein